MILFIVLPLHFHLLDFYSLLPICLSVVLAYSTIVFVFIGLIWHHITFLIMLIYFLNLVMFFMIFILFYFLVWQYRTC